MLLNLSFYNQPTQKKRINNSVSPSSGTISQLRCLTDVALIADAALIAVDVAVSVVVAAVVPRPGPVLHLVAAPAQVEDGAGEVDARADPEHGAPLRHRRVVRQQRAHHHGRHEPRHVAQRVGQREGQAGVGGRNV